MTEETLAVRERYVAAGLVVRQLHRIPDDHLGIELEFLFLLTRLAVEAAQAGDAETVLARLAERRDFIEAHFHAGCPASRND